MLGHIKEIVCKANKYLPHYGLVTFTWGNVSQIDSQREKFVIKPSGVNYDNLSAEDMVVLDLKGNIVEGNYKPSSDSKTHKVIYREFSSVGGIVHTHSTYATAWAQAGRNIPCYGTTHADYFYGDIPCIRLLTKDEITEDYEENIGKVIVDYFHNSKRDIMSVPAVICAGHGVFAWGKDAMEAVHNAKVVEEVAHMAFLSEMLNHKIEGLPQELQDKHYFRKHGPNAYYGQ